MDSTDLILKKLIESSSIEKENKNKCEEIKLKIDDIIKNNPRYSTEFPENDFISSRVSALTESIFKSAFSIYEKLAAKQIY